MKIKHLPQPYKEMALIEQEKQGNKRDENLLLIADVEDGNFCWSDSLCGSDFWYNVAEQNYPEITPEIKSKFSSVFNYELIDKWVQDIKIHENFAHQCKEEKFALMHEARIDQLKQCIKDYEKFINLKK
jgi:hypothetical protein